MHEGQQFQLSQILPYWMRPDDFYVIMAGAAALLCIWAISSSFGKNNHMASRIKAIQERHRMLQNASMTPKKRKRPETGISFMRAVVIKFQLLKKSQLGKTEALLMEAGFRSRDAIYVLTFFNLMTPLSFAIAGFIIMKFNASEMDTFRQQVLGYLWPIGGAYIGLKLPNYYVGRTRKKRYLHIQRALPDVLDLMTICAEAGLSLAGMLDRVSRELAISYPEMAEELALTSIEIGFLPDRNKALANLAERCTLPEVRGIVSVLIQTEKYGTPIAQALRVLSTEFRQARMLRAEEKAARLPALMTVPMIVFILPTLFIVIIAPAAVKLIDIMKAQ